MVVPRFGSEYEGHGKRSGLGPLAQRGMRDVDTGVRGTWENGVAPLSGGAYQPHKGPGTSDLGIRGDEG